MIQTDVMQFCHRSHNQLHARAESMLSCMLKKYDAWACSNSSVAAAKPEWWSRRAMMCPIHCSAQAGHALLLLAQNKEPVGHTEVQGHVSCATTQFIARQKLERGKGLSTMLASQKGPSPSPIHALDEAIKRKQGHVRHKLVTNGSDCRRSYAAKRTHSAAEITHCNTLKNRLCRWNTSTIPQPFAIMRKARNDMPQGVAVV